MPLTRVKRISAGVGAGAVIAMAAVGALSVSGPQGGGAQAQEPDITLDQTTTSTTAQTVIPTPLATPPVKAEPAPTASD